MKIVTTAFTLIVILFFASCDSGGKKEINYKDVKLTNINDSIAFTIGYNLGERFEQDSLLLDYDIIVAGFKAGFAKDSSILNSQDRNDMSNAIRQMVTERQERIRNQEMEAANKDNESFFAENRNKPGVTETESGLQYEVIEEGTGPKPGPESQVKVHYTGMLLDGTVFDSSVERGEPATFPLNRVIKGWTEGLQLMKKGAKWKFYVPPELGYGMRGNPPMIGPNAALIFEVELLEILEGENN